MNFLAHAYLSFRKPELLVGNMIADLVKGKQKEQYPQEIQRGIELHRKIDSFTDCHPVTQQAATLFRTSAGKYAGAFLDVAYDHFLATDICTEPADGWSCFAKECYAYVEQYGEILPLPFCSMFLYMRNEDWLSNYHHFWMIERSFERLKRRASYLADDAIIYPAFEQNYACLQEAYEDFFPELKCYAESIV